MVYNITTSDGSTFKNSVANALNDLNSKISKLYQIFRISESNQTTNLGAGNYVEFDHYEGSLGAAVGSLGGLPVGGGSSGHITLMPGRTYKLIFETSTVFSATSGSITMEMYSVTEGMAISKRLRQYPLGSTAAFSNSSVIITIFTPVMETVIGVKIVSSSSVASLNFSRTKLTIEEI